MAIARIGTRHPEMCAIDGASRLASRDTPPPVRRRPRDFTRPRVASILPRGNHHRVSR